MIIGLKTDICFSIQQIAEAPLKTVEEALNDPKAARAFQNACKAYLKRAQTSPTNATAAGKRPATGASTDQDASKRLKFSTNDGFLLGPTDLTPEQLESSLSVPVDTEEDRILETAVYTNRAPLVLAFAFELIRYTMPEQPPSSRLSLAMAVLSANSRTKAVSLGLEKGPSASELGIGEGQPRIKVMGREITVLKRGAYEWKGEEVEGVHQPSTVSGAAPLPAASTPKPDSASNTSMWSTSQSVSLKQSTFIARATTISDPAQRPKLLKSLFDAHPELRSATHNVWAYRIRPSESSTSTQLREASHDDGETGAGDLLVRVMRETNCVDTLVVMTRWFGGIMLGPDRWRLMRNVATSALSERLRRTGIEASLGGEALWGLDLEAMKDKVKAAAAAGGLVTHKPESARSYLLRSFASPPAAEDAESSASPSKKKTTKSKLDAEKEENLGLLLGAIRLLFDSWADHLAPQELDRRAWSWYTAIRPAVESGPSGWGGKGVVRLIDILNLRRKE